jgi:hypothetical protein
MMGKQTRPALTVVGILLLTACQSLIPTPEPSAGECFRSASVEVYADLDADGERDEGEPPLEGIDLGIIRSGDPPTIISQAETDADGNASLGFILSGDCNLLLVDA